MGVPFEALGPGQSGRLVYQVMGQNGPVFNPSSIRYLDPTQAAARGLSDVPVPNSDLVIGLAGVNLAASLGTLALTAATYQSVQQLHRKVDRLTLSVDKMRQTLEELTQKTERIDMRVAENNLREAMKHVFRKAWAHEELHLEPIAALGDDIAAVMDVVKPPYLLNCGIRLATDVRDHLTFLASFLRNLRFSVAMRHNMAVLGRPNMVLTMDLVNDYLNDISLKTKLAASVHQAAEVLNTFREQMVSAVNERFSFSDAEDVEFFEGLLNAQVIRPMVDSVESSGVSALMESVPGEAFEGTPDEIEERLKALTGAWLWASDAGLLWRAYQELTGLSSGYVSTFWPHLKDREAPQLAPGQPPGFLVDITVASEATTAEPAAPAAPPRRRSLW